jgi:hypothetical protein
MLPCTALAGTLRERSRRMGRITLHVTRQHGHGRTRPRRPLRPDAGAAAVADAAPRHQVKARRRARVVQALQGPEALIGGGPVSAHAIVAHEDRHPKCAAAPRPWRMRTGLRRKSLERAALFGWDRTAKLVLDGLTQVVAEQAKLCPADATRFR